MPASEVEILGEGPFEVARSKPRLCQGRKVSVDDFFHGPNLVELIVRHHETILWFFFPFIAGEICEDLDFFEIIFRDLNLHRYLRYESANLSQHSKNPETQDDFSKQNWQQTKLTIENFRQPPPQQSIYHFKEIVHPCPVSMSGFAVITSGPISKGYSGRGMSPCKWWLGKRDFASQHGAPQC